MNIFLWIIQILLAAHTIMGAAWKFTNSEDTLASLQAIPHNVWLSLIIFEFLCSLCLILPAFKKQLAMLAPVGAVGVGMEMLFFSGVLIFSDNPNYGQMIYWLIVFIVCALIAYGRIVMKPTNAESIV
ncbi:hypothetical protein BTA51_14615 [Hahella sp. CCB-MM4]|uniref:hypothetical protein n=1 Tax=Hahella sp. (strain CCB-MM4) TaxID=1926491 RepID=UPI000B9BF10C|nr:hypothetical protein [Hahella sp. CCB-MM4]OZG72752.1 hypothetical protein BTA51_14615 [Hahella sp. CCB-MM4]